MAQAALTDYAEITTDRKYTYPSSEVMPDYFITFYGDGSVNFHRGMLFSGTPNHLGQHHVKIVRGGQVVFDEDVPIHIWNAQWNWRPDGSLTVKKSPYQLAQDRKMFHYGNTGLPLYSVPDCVYKGANDNAGITKYMPQTGLRGDLGLITDWSALYLAGGPAGPMIAQALARQGIPNYARDETTGKLIDLLKYPTANMADLKGLQGEPFILKGPPDTVNPIYSQYGGGWTPQQAHYPSLSYVAHLTTLDPHFLFDLQASANFTIFCDAAASDREGRATINGERRGVAWALRNLFEAWKATKDWEDTHGGTVPEGCFDSVYFDTLIGFQYDYYTRLMKAETDPLVAAFGLCPPEARLSPWQQDYLAAVFLFGVLIGRAEFAELALFNLDNVLDRTSDLSGWPSAWGTPYRINLVPNGDPSAGLPYFTWAQAFADQVDDFEVKMDPALNAKLKADPTNGGVFCGEWGYYGATYAVHVMADYLDKKGWLQVRARYPYFDKCLKTCTGYYQQIKAVDARNSVVLDGSLSKFVPAPVADAPSPTAPSDPGQSGSTAPGEVYPGPDQPSAADGSIVTTLDNLRVTLAPGNLKESEIGRVLGNGNTDVQVIWPGENLQIVRIATQDSSWRYQEIHSSGNWVTLKSCAGLSINGSRVITPPVTTPDPAPEETPQPATGVTLMPSTLALKIGESHQLNLTVTPADADRTGLVYRAVPDGVVTLDPNAAGVAVTRTKAGNVQIFADLNGHEAEADATYTPPLAESLVLEWA